MKSNKTNKKQPRRLRKSRQSRKRNRSLKKIKGGNVAFPASFSSSQNPQSYLPYNDFSKDPNYGMIDSRLTQPFLTGVSTGGRRRRKAGKTTGGSSIAYGLTNALNTSVGQITSGGLLTDVGGVAGSAANLTGSNNVYNSNPSIPLPLA